jgi:hypothetical protein
MSVTIRIPEAAYATARRHAEEGQRTIGEVIAEAIVRYEEEQWWAEVDAAYARLRGNPAASAEYDAEMALWDTALMDGLEDWPYEGIEELRG